MKKRILSLAFLTFAAAAWPAAVSAAPNALAPSGSAEIPFVNHGGIRDWTAGDDDTLFVQAMSGKWYEVDLMSSCSGLPFATRVGFDTGPIDTFDRFSTVIVDGQRCPVQSVSLMASPPAGYKK